MRAFWVLLGLAAITTASATIPGPVERARGAAFNLLWQDKNSGNWYAICSGSIMQLKDGVRAVTAGHCVDDYPNGSYAVLMSSGETSDLVLEEHSFVWPFVNINSAGGSSGTIMLNDRGEAVGILVGGFAPTVKLSGSFLAPLPE